MPALSRREFLFTVGAGLVTCSSVAFGRDIESDLVYLLNDTHIGEKHPPSSQVPSHLRQSVKELLGLKAKPACVLINGDLALKDGQPGDYRHFAELLGPLHEANLDVHLTLGNHDNRKAFYDVMKEERREAPPVESRHISLVQTQLANFFLLDSLKETMVTHGTIGIKQRVWLAKALTTAAKKDSRTARAER